MILMYIGDGKGKTTAAVGLAVRAAGAGSKVLFAQFVKAAKVTGPGEWPQSSELKSFERIKNITVKILGRGFVGILGDKKKHAQHVKAARIGLKWLKKEINSKRYKIIIADELISAVELKLLTQSEVLQVFRLAQKKLEALAVTGHTKYPRLIKAADLVTEMKMIKHPYYKGILAKRGIDF